MAEEYKVSLGVELNQDSLNEIKNQLNNLKPDKPIQITFDIDAKNQLSNIKKAISDLGKNKGLGNLNIDADKINQQFNELVANISEMRSALGSLNKDAGMKSLLTTVNELGDRLQSVAIQFESLAKSIGGMNFNLNFNMGNSNNPITNNARYGSKARSETVPKLREQAQALGEVVKQYDKLAHDWEEANVRLVLQTTKDKRIDIYKMLADMGDASNIAKQMDTYRQYIKLIQEGAKLKGIDLSGITSRFSKSADQLVQDTQKILTGEQQVKEQSEETTNALKKIFGGSNVDISSITAQLDTIINNLAEVNHSIQNLSSTISVDGLTESFNNLSVSIQSIMQNCSNMQTSMTTGFNGATNAVNNVGNTVDKVSSSISNINLEATQEQIDNMKMVLQSFELDDSSIGAVIEKLNNMNLTITNITTELRKNGSISIKVTGIDDIGRTVTALKSVKKVLEENENGELVWNGEWDVNDDFATTISQSFKQVKKQSQEVVNAYKEMRDIISEISSIEIKLTGLDSEKDAGQIEALNNRLNELSVRYKELDSTFGQSFNTSQISNLSNAWDKVISQISIAEGKLADAAKFNQLQSEIQQTNKDFADLFNVAKQIDNLELKIAGLDVNTNANEIVTLQSQLDNLKKTYQDLYIALQGKLSIDQLAKLATTAAETEDKIAQLKSRLSDMTLSQEAQQWKKDVTDTANQIAALSKMEAKLNIDTNEQEFTTVETQLDKLKEKYEQLISSFASYSSQLTLGDVANLNKIFEQMNAEIDRITAKLIDKKNNFADSIKATGISDFEKQFSNVELKLSKISFVSDEARTAFENFRLALERVKETAQNGSADELIRDYEELKIAAKNAANQVTILANEQKQAVDAQKLQTKKDAFATNMDVWLKNNSAAAKMFGARIEDLKRRLESCDNIQLNGLLAEFDQLKKEAVLAGVNTKTFADQLKNKFSKVATYFSASMGVSEVVQGLRQMYDNVVEVDTAMTELLKVTDETEATYDKFLSTVGDTAQKIGTTMDGLITSTADFARLGYSFDDAQTLAEVANVYAVVGDDIDSVDTATKSIISTLAAFKIETSDAISIVDKFNEVGNNFAISSGGIGEALERSASSLAAANNTLDESIALITAANTVVQDPEAVGRLMPT